MFSVLMEPKAKEQFLGSLDYCKQEYGERIAAKLIEKVELFTKRLAMNPEMGYPEPLLKDFPQLFRSYVIDKFHKVIYYVEEEISTIYIVGFWDVRREPSKLPKELK